MNAGGPILDTQPPKQGTMFSTARLRLGEKNSGKGVAAWAAGLLAESRRCGERRGGEERVPKKQETHIVGSSKFENKLALASVLLKG